MTKEKETVSEEDLNRLRELCDSEELVGFISYELYKKFVEISNNKGS